MPKTEAILPQRRPRKSTIWTRQKVALLIELYRKAECLWNHQSGEYKVRECRKKAADRICSTLGITQYDYMKKIHNLRNQFNSEMKKLERRFDECGAGGDEHEDDEDSSNTGTTAAKTVYAIKSCRWEHFESLMFLHGIIEHRPGGSAAPLPLTLPTATMTTATTQSSKKHRTKLEYEEHMDDCLLPPAAAKPSDFEPGTPTTASRRKPSDDNSSYHTLTNVQNIHDITAPQLSNADYASVDAQAVPATMDVTTLSHNTNGMPMAPAVSNNNETHNHVAAIQANHMQETSLPAQVTVQAARDQWDSFGELIANEFRHLNSDVSRKKLKRRIMQAMLEVGIEDDSLS